MGTESHTVFTRPSATPAVNGDNIHYSTLSANNYQNNVGTKHGAQSIIPRSPPQLKNTAELQKIAEEYGVNVNNSYASLREKTNRIITRISSVFPFEFFPDTIEVEENKITVILRQFFACSQTHSIDMHDIANVFVETAPFFATIKITTRNFVENNVKVNWLKRKDAMYTRNIIEGLRIFSQDRIDTSKYELKDLVKRLEYLSTIKIMMHPA